MPAASIMLLIGAAVFGAFTLYVWVRRGNPGGKALMLMLVAGVWYTATYALELSSRGIEAEMLWGNVKYLGVCLLPPAWLVFTLQYTGRGRWLTRRFLLLLSIEPLAVLTLLIVPGTAHLIHVYPATRTTERFSVVRFGPVGWINVFYSYALSVYSTGLFVTSLASLARPYRRPARALIVALLLPFGFNILYNFDVGPFGRVDLTPFAFFFAVLVLVWGIFRLRLLDIVPMARTRIVETMQDGVLVLDAYQRVVELNPAAQHLIGCTSAQAVGRSLHQLLPGYAHLLERSAGSTGARAEVRLPVGAAIRTFEVSVSPIPDGASRESGKLLVFRDVSERKTSEERLERMAHYDALTGLPNRKLFADRLSQTIIRARRNSELVGLLFLDVDHFKDVNDTLGHDVGDMLLQQLATRLQECLRAEDTVARLSGDEFIVLLPQTQSPTDAAVAANRILEALVHPISAGGHELYVGASIGICVWPRDGEDPGTLVRNADVAMYRAKAKGRNRAEFYASDLSTHSARRLELEGELHRALERGELRIHYQPIVSLATGQVTSLEALVRWQHPTRGLIPPTQFLWRAEETGLIEPIGRWVLEASCRDALGWPSTRGRRVSVAVNLSARQLGRSAIVGEIEDVLRRTGLGPEDLVLEISEGTVLDDALTGAGILYDLKGLGVGLSLDDFGTGSTSLSELGRVPLDVLKIDRLFVQRLGRDPHNAIVVRAMVSLAHALGLAVVAEGVETPAQLGDLQTLGCDLVQGFLISEPLPLSAIPSLVHMRERAWAGTT